MVVDASLSLSTASSSNNNNNKNKSLRFRSTSGGMDGSFPRHLFSDNNNNPLLLLLKHNLVRLKATALMEEKRLPIGAQVAFALSVWIVDPVRFFAIFSEDDNNVNDNDSSSSSKKTTLSYSKQFLASGRTATAGGRRTASLSAAASSSGVSLASCRESAFALLQWAQHGKQGGRNHNENDSSDNDDDDNENDNSNSSSNSNNDGDSDSEGDADVDIDAATSTVHASAMEEETAIPEWARDVLRTDNNNNDNNNGGDDTTTGNRNGNGNNIHNIDTIQTMETPRGFREGIRLRPYQKQSLYWMTQREKKSPSGRNQLLRLLHELAGSSASTACTGSSQRQQGDDDNECVVLEGYQNGISCDCGPVVVDTDRVEAPSIARGGHLLLESGGDDGNGNDDDEPELNHPLWERRFLCNQHQTKALSFFVQPSFRNAAAEPPPPPLPCRGGILADSMG